MPRGLSQSQLRQALRQPNEKALQRDVVQLLRQLGYVVMETGRPMRQAHCPHCHSFFHVDVGTSNTTACPDIFAAHPSSGNYFKAMELKAPGTASLLGTLQPGRIRPEQQKLVDLGVSDIVTSVDAALTLVEELRK